MALSVLASGEGVHLNTHNPRLIEVLDRTRAAILGLQVASNDWNATTRPTEPPAPLVRLTVPVLPPVPVLRPSCAPLDTITARCTLKAGPRRLLELLHQVAVSTVTARAYPIAPSQVTIHQPKELLAAALGCSLRSVYNWTQTLQLLGLLDARPHFTTSKGATRVDGTLYAVALRPRHIAHLPHDDLKHEWRDLDGDRAAGRTAWRILAGSDTDRAPEGWRAILEAWALCPGSTEPPLFPDSANSPATLQDAAHMLPLIATAHPDKRPALVGLIASTLARALDDQHSRRWYCRAIWNAWTAEVEGRAGLQVLAAQLARLDADRREWAGLRRPGALLAARLR